MKLRETKFNRYLIAQLETCYIPDHQEGLFFGVFWPGGVFSKVRQGLTKRVILLIL